MSKSLYEEAIGDVRRIKQVAEDNAKRTVLDQVVPRIKKLIEEQLLNETVDPITGEEDEGDLLLEPDPMVLQEPTGEEPGNEAPAGAPELAGQVVAGDEDGKLVLDLDALCSASDVCGDLEAELSFGGAAGMAIEAVDIKKEAKLIENTARRLFGASDLLVSTKGYKSHVERMLKRCEGAYAYLQENVAENSARKNISNKLEETYQILIELQEKTNMKQRLHEDDQLGGDELAPEEGAEITLKLTGLPDDVDLDDVGVDIITGGDGAVDGEDGAGDEFGDMDLDLDGGEGGDVDFGDGDELPPEDDDQSNQFEAFAGLSGDQVIEIDEKVLVKEINRMRKVREAFAVAKQTGPDATSYDSFGGGDDEGDPLDVDIDTVDSSEVVEARRPTKTLTKGSTRNGAPKQQAESAVVQNLRSKLTEANLHSVKLGLSNKVLLSENLTKQQKGSVIRRLQAAVNPREAKLVYESTLSLVEKPVAPKAPVRKATSGSSSAPTRSGQSTSQEPLNEGIEIARWSTLAGIK
jgi:hypothetical protein